VAVASENGISVGVWLEKSVRTSCGGFITGGLELSIEEGSVKNIFGDEYEIEVSDAG
jgi:hypothetical protein